MNNKQKPIALFLFGCIPARLFLAYLAYSLPSYYLRILGVIGLVIAGSFFYLFLSGKRKTGFETFGQPIWWNDLRPVHGFLYLLFALAAIQGQKTAYIYLLVDVIFGFSSFLLFHYKQGDLF